MFIGKIQTTAEQDKDIFSPAIQKAVEYLRSRDFTQVPDGKYPIDGEKIYAKVERYHTRPQSECRPEAHRKFIDIQYVAEGEECLGWCPVSPDLKLAVPYDSEKDVMFYEKLIPDSSLVLTPDCYAVLYTDDVHSPCMSLDDEHTSVTKVVIKVAVELI